MSLSSGAQRRTAQALLGIGLRRTYLVLRAKLLHVWSRTNRSTGSPALTRDESVRTAERDACAPGRARMSLSRRAATGGISIIRRDLDRAETLSFAWGVSPPLSDLNPQVKPPGERKTAMKNHNPLTNSIDPVRNSRNRSSGAGWTRAFLLLRFALVLASFALSPTARAVDPPPDGGYPNENTAEGEDALFSLTDGSFNTAVGYHALYSNTTGSANTAVGEVALRENTTGES